jgi:cytochrome c6
VTNYIYGSEENILKRLLSILLLAIALTITNINKALAETSNGAKIFTSNCAACHIGGSNVLIANKTLKKDALEKYLDTDPDLTQAIIYQVLNGKNAMPAFKDRLNQTEIFDVSAYVLEQAEKGW